MAKKPTIALIIPCYNEAENLQKTPEIVSSYISNLIKEKKIGSESFILFVDDGSDDGSKELLETIKTKYKNVDSITLDQNYGHQIAIIAGMDFSVTKSDAMISIDCDLQQELPAIAKFIASYNKGNQIVLGVRKNRSKEKIFKTITAQLYHTIITAIGIKYVKGHSDFRLVDSAVYSELQRLIWANQFLRSVFSNTKYKTDVQTHEVFERLTGSTKYSFPKMLALGLEGIFTNSLLTLRFFGFFGLIVSIFSILLIFYGLFAKFFLEPVEGWSSIFLIISFFGGITVFSFSLLSEAILRLLKQFLGGHPYRINYEK